MTAPQHLKTSSKAGFTLIELMVAISIVAILATVGMVMYSSAQSIARDSKRREDLKTIQKVLELYKVDNGNYPQIAQSGGGPWFCDSSGNFAVNSAMVAALAPYFPGGIIPTDPINDSTYRYKLDLLKDNNIYFLYAKQEKAPTVTQTLYGVGSTPPAGVNGDACTGTIQVDILYTNLQ